MPTGTLGLRLAAGTAFSDGSYDALPFFGPRSKAKIVAKGEPPGSKF